MPRPIVFVGDSITEGWGEAQPGLFARHGFVNRGIGGEASGRIRARFRDEILAAGARGVHLMCGINDIAEVEGPVPLPRIQENIAAMVAEGRRLGLPVWLGSITPATAIAWNPEVSPRPSIAALNRWLREHAAGAGARFIDYHAVLATEEGALRPGFGSDGVHLTPEGYRAMEAILLAALGAHGAASGASCPPAGRDR
ncbi:lysophospholipase L1-like esterase [Methylobacterium sp. BE186]|uniref:GDSL-type esterase/lipase family protein n=1 Tax=Methylobacterium sp. BE186 TaxID=2817715 RepID=UPI0028577B2C|nr:GDSL-type esterase/lipase family protein [Methylobacterium sp. BE186]MDR7039315.1 lysophospholipase L1-like esterase [Methylobacterium sp. BE186]